MLHRWKLILSNWNNCFNEDNNEKAIDSDSLHNIISYLRQNLNQPNSVLQANTVKEFIEEKYPEFKFENGNLELTNEDEVYLIASLLLYFVCINSKDKYLKHAMCSKLSSADQEIIMKFSKSLMDCPVIRCGDVMSAITEACGSEEASTEARHTVSETPPALRSLHGEVRRLQAALDAERFDRNYLQEELARTQFKLDKLNKEKEQYKLEIMNLKAKISLCGEESETRAGDDVTDRTAKLTRQLQQLEEKLVETQGQLDDLAYERDVYKNKVEELKSERDKWLTLSQEESIRATQLSEQLELERTQVHTLKELIAELKQHNKLNRMDSSIYECDDPNASIQSLPHNASVCSEACANVVEVQLGEERAKIVILQQQIETLQEQINELNNKTETERKSYETIISERENNIFNLKHRINEEIEEKNNMKMYYDNEMTKLNNEINELEQRLKDNGENSRNIIDKKMEEIQILQEEKLSLLHSLNNETTKLDNVIKKLETELENEKQSKSNMRDGYENHLMKLNEKVLNRNNELVELQNTVFEKGEQIELLQFELRKLKEKNDELMNKYHDLDEKKQAIDEQLQQKTDKVNDLQTEVTTLKKAVSDLSDNCKILNDTKNELLNDLHTKNDYIKEIKNEIEILKTNYAKQIEKLTVDLDERIETIHSLQTQLKSEIQFKIELQNELEAMKSHCESEMENTRKLNADISKYIKDLEDKNTIINSMDIYIQEEKKINKILNEKITDLNKDVNNKDEQIKFIEEKLATANDSIKEMTQKNAIDLEDAIIKINNLITEKEALESVITNKQVELNKLQANYTELEQKSIEKDSLMKFIEKTLTVEATKYQQLEASFVDRMSKLFNRISDTEKNIINKTEILRNKLIEKYSKIASLKSDLQKVNNDNDIMKNNLAIARKDNEDLNKTLNDEIKCKNKLEKDLEHKNKQHNKKMEKLNHRIEDLTKTVKEKTDALKDLEEKLNQEIKIKNNITLEFKAEIKKLNVKISELESLNEELDLELKKVLNEKNIAIQALQQENEQLQFTIEEDNSNHELIITEKDTIIDNLEKRIRQNAAEYKTLIQTLDSHKFDSEIIIKEKAEEIVNLTDQVNDLKTVINQMEVNNNKYKQTVEQLVMRKEELEKQVFEEKQFRDALETEKDHTIEALIAEKEILTQDIIEERSNKKMAEDEKNLLLNEKNLIKKHLNIELDNIKNLNNDIATLNEVLKKERLANGELNQMLDIITAEKKVIENKLQEIETIRTEQCEEINILNKKIELLEADLNKFKEIIENNKTTIKEKDEQLDKEKKNYNYLMNEMQDLHFNLDEMRSNLDGVVTEKNMLETKIIDLEDRLKTEESYSMKVREDNINLNTKINNLETDSKALNDAYNNVTELLNFKNKEIETAREEIDSNIVIIKHLNYDNEQILNEEHLILQERDQIKTLNENLVDELNVLNEKLLRLNENYIELQTEFKIKDEQLLKSVQMCDQLKPENDHYKETNSQINNILNAGITKIINKLKAEPLNNTLLQSIIQNDIENDTVNQKCTTVLQIVDALSSEVENLKNMEKLLKSENEVVEGMRESIKQKEMEIFNLQSEIKRLEQVVVDTKNELTKQKEDYATSMNCKIDDIHKLQQENQTLHAELNDVKVQLEVKVHSLKEKLVDNEHLTDKLKQTYESQIDNLNVMVTKLTNYMKEKSVELDNVRKEKEQLMGSVADSCKVIKSLQDDLKIEKENMDKIITEFESERQVLKNMVTVTESVMEDQKQTFNNIINDHLKDKEILNDDIKALQALKKATDLNLAASETANASLLSLIKIERDIKCDVEKESEMLREYLDGVMKELCDVNALNCNLKSLNNDLGTELSVCRNDINSLQKTIEQVTAEKESLENLLKTESEKLAKIAEEKSQLETQMHEKEYSINVNDNRVKELSEQLNILLNDKEQIETSNRKLVEKIEEFKINIDKLNTEKHELEMENNQLTKSNTENAITIKDINDKLNTVVKENQHLTNENKEITIKLEKINEKLNMLIREKEQLELDKNQLIIENEENINIISNLNERLDIVNKEKEQLDMEKSKFITENETQVNVISQANEQLNTVLKEKEVIEMKKLQLIEERDLCMIKIEELNNKLNDLGKEKEQLDLEKNQLLTQNKEYANKLEENEEITSELRKEKEELTNQNKQYKNQIRELNEKLINVFKEKSELEVEKNMRVIEIGEVDAKINNIIHEKHQLEIENNQLVVQNEEYANKIEVLNEKLNCLVKENNDLESEKMKFVEIIKELNDCKADNELLLKLKDENQQLVSALEESKSVITNIEQLIEQELRKNNYENETEQTLQEKCTYLLQYKDNAEKMLQQKELELNNIQTEVQNMKERIDLLDKDGRCKDGVISKMSREKDAIIATINKQLIEERLLREKYQKELESLKLASDEVRVTKECLLKQETYGALGQEKAGGEKYPDEPERLPSQVPPTDTPPLPPRDTVADLETIVRDRNRTITALHTDITYLKSLVADSENKLLDANRELALTREHCDHISAQLEKIALQKNEEIAELRRQLARSAAAETKASEIVRVSAKYHALIKRRIAEIKSDSALKELTNLVGGDERRGAVTGEELERFLDSTERQLRRCAERAAALQRDRDRLQEVARIREEEALQLRAVLEQAGAGLAALEAARGEYAGRLARAVALQRAARRDLLRCAAPPQRLVALERAHGAALQDALEAALALQRWAERCLAHTVSAEKLRCGAVGRADEAPPYRSAALEVQLAELERRFAQLQEQAAAAGGAGAGEGGAQAVHEVRAEYEDKLNRMKAKMKELFNEQMTVIKQKQKDEIALLERELQKTRDNMEEMKRSYETHIKELTKELWRVGEKYLVKNEEAQWLKKKQRSGSLMSLQHVHSSGLVVQEPPSRPSDAHSLRSLQISNKREDRGLQMCEEEGEVFDNRCLGELSTPRRESGARLSELRWRNSLCPPHLKSSYPAETQFTPAVQEDDIKAGVGKPQRKEVGITAYKKPGPPTPSKQAGRLSATDSELRESLRVDNDPHPDRKTSTPARIRAFLSFKKNDTNDGTPRARRLSNMFRKK